MWTHHYVTTPIASAIALLSFTAPTLAAPGDSELISRTEATVQPTGNFSQPTVSADGRYVAFASWGPIAVPGDDYTWSSEVYVRDRALGRTVRASLRADGTAFASWSRQPRLSANGRFVALVSDFDLAAGDGIAGGGVFVRDLQAGTTELVSVDSSGLTGTGGDNPAISADGRYVAFTTNSALVAQDTNARSDVYVRDRVAGHTELASVDSNERLSDGNSVGTLSLSADGRHVAFTSYAHNLVAGDTNEAGDVFVRDRLLGTTERISVTSSGVQTINQGSGAASLSADGRYVVFVSWAWNLVREDTNRASDIFLHDRVTRRTDRVSISSTGAQANAASSPTPSISADGRFVSFVSGASNLVAGDTNGVADVFVRDRTNGTTARVARVSKSASVSEALTSLTAAGDAVVFATPAALVADDRDGGEANSWDVYLTELGAAPAAYAFTLKPMRLDFGEHALGTSTSRNFWLRNKGTTALPLRRVGVRGEDRAMFAAANACGVAIAPGSGCAITVTFVPTAVGAHTAKLFVVAGDGAVREQWISGIGTDIP